MQGSKGDIGNQGDKGQIGLTGPSGKKGLPGIKGQSDHKGFKGMTGEKGENVCEHRCQIHVFMQLMLDSILLWPAKKYY